MRGISFYEFCISCVPSTCCDFSFFSSLPILYSRVSLWSFFEIFFFFFCLFSGLVMEKKWENGGGLEINFSLPLYVRYFSNMVRYVVVICNTKCVGMSLLRSVLARCYTMIPKLVRGESSRIKRVLNSLV